MLDALAGMSGLPATNRSLPSLSAFQAVAGLVLGMGIVVPCAPGRHAVSIPAAELVEWYGRARRDLPWRAPGVTAWQILVKRVHAAADPGRPGGADLAGLGGPLAHAIGDGRRRRGRRAARVGQLGYPRRPNGCTSATVIATDHADVVPDDVDTLLTLPGVGAYTARAVACFAYQRGCRWWTPTRRVVARAMHGARMRAAHRRCATTRMSRRCCPTTGPRRCSPPR